VLESTPPPASSERASATSATTRPATTPPPPRTGPIDLLVELYTYGIFGACMTATLPFVAASHLRHRGEVPRMPGRWVRRLGKTAASLTPLWDFAIEGEPPADIHTRPYVVVANHLSMADPFLLSSLPWDMQWVAKEVLFKVPVVGWILSLGGDIALRRGSGESVRAMLDQCRRALDGGLSVMLFPEGTRSATPGVAAFKDGAFDLAIERGVPLLPVAVAGTSSCMRKGSSRLGRAKAAARILSPVETKGMTKDDVATLRDGTRGRIIEAMNELDAKLAGG
jgi:1-acyl-sn-glycerol-3-phosphate acyltransferase